MLTLAIERVKLRVQDGGHNIETDVIADAMTEITNYFDISSR